MAAVFQDTHQESQLVVLHAAPGAALEVRATFTTTLPIIDVVVQDDVVFALERYAGVHALQMSAAPILERLGSFAEAGSDYYPAALAADDSQVAVVLNPFSPTSGLAPQLALYGATPWTSGKATRIIPLTTSPQVSDSGSLSSRYCA